MLEPAGGYHRLTPDADQWGQPCVSMTTWHRVRWVGPARSGPWHRWPEEAWDVRRGGHTWGPVDNPTELPA